MHSQRKELTLPERFPTMPHFGNAVSVHTLTERCKTNLHQHKNIYFKFVEVIISHNDI